MANPKDKDSMESSSEESTPTKELLGQNSEEDDEEEVAPTPTLDTGGRVTKKFCVELIQFYKQQRRLPTQTALK